MSANDIGAHIDAGSASLTDQVHAIHEVARWVESGLPPSVAEQVAIVVALESDLCLAEVGRRCEIGLVPAVQSTIGTLLAQHWVENRITVAALADWFRVLSETDPEVRLCLDLELSERSSRREKVRSDEEERKERRPIPFPHAEPSVVARLLRRSRPRATGVGQPMAEPAPLARLVRAFAPAAAGETTELDAGVPDMRFEIRWPASEDEGVRLGVVLRNPTALGLDPERSIVVGFAVLEPPPSDLPLAAWVAEQPIDVPAWEGTLVPGQVEDEAPLIGADVHLNAEVRRRLISWVTAAVVPLAPIQRDVEELP